MIKQVVPKPTSLKVQELDLRRQMSVSEPLGKIAVFAEACPPPDMGRVVSAFRESPVDFRARTAGL